MPSATALGDIITVSALAAVRPSSASGVSRCTAVSAAISTHGRPTPISAQAVSATASDGTARRPTATPNTAIPAAGNTRPGSRRISGPASSPTATDPMPCATDSTPAYAGEWPRTPPTTAYSVAPLSPAHSIVAEAARTRGRSTGDPHSCRSPAVRPPGAAGPGRAVRRTRNSA